jgi:hypothetical protein
MLFYTTFDAAKKVGIPYTTLVTHLVKGKVPKPKAEIAGKSRTQIWTEEEIEHIRQLLPKLANGRKTRYKKQTAPSSQQSRNRSAKAKGKTRSKKKK